MSWQAVLSQAGYRLSEPRKRVMQLLGSSDTPLPPMAIYARLKQQGFYLGMVSVYRALDLLTRLGLAAVVYQEDGGTGYVIATHGHHHHILCQACHRVIEFEGSEDLEDMIHRVETETKFKVEDHLLQLFGLCPDCQQNLQKREDD